MMMRWRMCLGTVVLFLLLLATALYSLSLFQRLVREMENQRALHAEVHLRDPSELAEALRLSHEVVGLQLTQVAVIVFGSVVASGLVAVWTFRRFGRAVLDPLEEITRRVEAMEEEGFAVALPEDRRDEVGRLARAVNGMAARIRGYLKQSDDKFIALGKVHRALLHALPSPVFRVRADAGIEELNPAAEQLLQRLGLDGVLPAAVQRLADEARRSGGHYLPEQLKESVYLRAGNEELYFLPRILQLEAEDGKTQGLAVLLVDVSRFRWLDDMKTSQIATISHEIKTPLTGIRIMLHLLLEKKYGELNARQEEMMTACMEDCERLLKTLNNLLALSRMESGSEQLLIRPVDPGLLLRQCSKLLEEEFRRPGLEFEIRHGADLPPVAVDESRLQHVLGNLALNALKHARSRIVLSAAHGEPGWVRLSVQDDGPGVPEEYQTRIFDRFFRIPGQSTDGVGLGLSIAREIVRAHEGRIGVESKPNGGACFHVDLPISMG